MPEQGWKFTLAAAAALAATMLISAPKTEARPRDGHVFVEEDCSSCHVTEGDGGSWMLTFPTADISARCVECHSSCDNGSSHLGRREDPAVMEQALPLVGNERISCATCHRTHGGPGEGVPSPRAARLRLSNLKRGLCLNCHREEREGRVMVRIAAPPEAAVVYGAHLPLIGRIENFAGSHLRLEVNGAEFPLRVSGGYFHTRIRVEEGINRIRLSLYGDVLWTGNVFRARGSDGAAAYADVFSGHQTDSIQECLGCHEGEGGLMQVTTPALPDLCYRCHEPFDEKRYLHGPLAVGECTSCHDPHGGTGPSHLRAGEVALCLGCHEEEEVLGHRGGRIAMSAGGCSVCHDPHESDTRFLQKEASFSGSGD